MSCRCSVYINISHGTSKNNIDPPKVEHNRDMNFFFSSWKTGQALQSILPESTGSWGSHYFHLNRHRRRRRRERTGRSPPGSWPCSG